MDKAKELLEKIKGGWNNIGTKKKIAMISVTIVLLISMSLIAYFSQKVNYTTLFSEIEPADAGRIVNDLEAKKIKYILENQGRKILIDEKHIDKYRLQMAMEGNMPESSAGFEMFDSIGLMATDEDRLVMHQRAVTGELERSIMSLEAVNKTKVNLVMSEKSIFDTKAREASASIIIEFKPEYRITTDMIKGIAALVSGAVDNLPTKNIQIIDSKGNLLSHLLDDEITSNDLLTQRKQIKEDFEYKLESDLMDLLGSIFGRDKVKVKVYSDLDFDAQESTTVRYDNPVVRSEHLDVSGDDIELQDVTGGNIGDGISNVIEGVAGAGSTYSRIINNEITTETINTIKAPGRVERMTTSVIYDGNLSAERIQQIQNVVAAAIGFDEERGDTINVDGIVFDQTYQNRIDAELDGKDGDEPEGFLKKIYSDYKNLINIGLGILVLSVLVTFIITRLKSRKKRKENQEFAQELPLYPMDTEMAETKEKQVDIDLDLGHIKVEENLDSLKAQSYAKDNPDAVADLIRAWMKN